MTERWNHNVHYHRIVLESIRGEPRDTALDIGTGNGLLAADLTHAVPHVVGIDRDAGVLESARGEVAGVEWIHADVMTYPFDRTFDVVASVAAIHHLPDIEAALVRFAELTSPGGILVVIGMARSGSVIDHVVDLGGVIAHQWLSRRHQYYEHTAPILWPPPDTYSQVRQTASRVLPGVRWKRLALFRYSLIWHRPIG